MRTNQQKLTSPSGCGLVYDSSGEPAEQPARFCACEQSAPLSELEVGGATSVEDIRRRASRRAPVAAVAEC